jgi:tRNA (guanine-N7-)-methyltransferase
LDPGQIGLSAGDLPALPDDLMRSPTAGRLDPREWFGDPSRPFEIEIGSGKGTFLLAQSRAEPGVNFLGIEWAGEFFAYAADRLRRAAVENVRMLHGDATEFLRWRCPDAVVRVVHLYFSDPWPKTKHHKNRVVQDRFLADVWRVLVPGGELRVVTDHDELWEWDQEHFSRWCGTGPAPGFEGALPGFEKLDFEPPASAGEDELVGSNFERKFRREGRSFHACVLRRLG